MSDTRKPGLVSRILRGSVSVTLTLAVLAASGAAVMFGAEALALRAADVPPPEAAPVTKVSVVELVRQEGYRVDRRFVGQVEARATVALSFELGGRLVELTVDEGDQVAEGQILARLDTALLAADERGQSAARDATASQLEFAEARLMRAEALRKQGFTSQEGLDQARTTRDELRSRIAEIDARLQSVRINLEKSVLKAPFAGRIGSQFMDEGAALSTGQAVASLIETGSAEVRIGLPLELSEADLAGAEIDINGTVFEAELIQFRPDIDPVTRTRTALFAIDTDTPPVFGQTATLLLKNTVLLPGVWVQMDALQEGAGGVWTVLVVEDGIVRSSLVELLHVEETRTFVRGTFRDGALMVATGAHRVVPGQSVEILNVEG